MGKITGFMEFQRAERPYEPVEKRVKTWGEFVVPLGEKDTKIQAARCMDCGIPYCHNGCPVNNQIPDWNDLVYNGHWRQALDNLHSTNNFPEVTGRICPAPCEASCTLNLDDNPVAIKTIECAIVDKGWEEGWIVPQPPGKKSGKIVAIVGSGPAGMAAAQQLARAGHAVTVYEKSARPGGLMVYGIPDFKMEKSVIERRVKQMEAEGVTFVCNAHVGATHKIEDLQAKYDAVLLAGGAEKPRDLTVPGRDLRGIHYAMHFLPQQNRRVAKEALGLGTEELAKDKHVVVIGGGDTGSDCIGTSLRQGATSVTQLEIMPAPPEKENKLLSWPHWPLKMRTSSSQAEGAKRDFAVTTQRFEGKGGHVTSLVCARIDDKFKEIPDSEFTLPADMVLLAMGFVAPVQDDVIAQLGLDLDNRGNVKADDRAYATSRPKVYVAGDMRRGQSLVVWAIREGRQAAHAIDKALSKDNRSDLPR